MLGHFWNDLKSFFFIIVLHYYYNLQYHQIEFQIVSIHNQTTVKQLLCIICGLRLLNKI